MFIPKVIKT